MTISWKVKFHFKTLIFLSRVTNSNCFITLWDWVRRILVDYTKYFHVLSWSIQCGYFRISLPLRFYVKSILKNVGVQILPLLQFHVLWILFLENFTLENGKKSLKSEHQKCQIGNFWNFWMSKNWFHVKSG